MGFKSAAWVSDRWFGFANQWLGWWVWWPLLAPTGLMVCVCGFVDGLMVCVCVCVWLCVLNRCYRSRETEEKKYCWKAQENRFMPKFEKK